MPDASALEASLVRVHLVRKFPGLVVRGRWVPESSVVEILDLGGIVLDAEGNIAVFTVVPWLRSPDEESEFFVLSDDKRELPAQLIGVDQRISLLLVQVREKLGAPPAQIRGSPDEGALTSFIGMRISGGLAGFGSASKRTRILPWRSACSSRQRRDCLGSCGERGLFWRIRKVNSPALLQPWSR